MTWVIRYFDKVSEAHVGEFELLGISLEQLQRIFEVPSDNPMYDSFLVTDSQIPILAKIADIDFDESLYEYFLEYDA